MRFRVALLMLVFVTAGAAQSNVSNVSSAAPGPWVGTWAASPFDGDPWHQIPTVVDSTLREIVHTSIGGNAVRVHLTNEFGREPLRVEAVTVAVSAGTSSVDAATLHNLRFGNSPSIVIPAGAEAVSDPVAMPIPAAANLAVSIYLPLQQVSNVSVHSSAQQDNFIATGNHVRDASFTEPVVAPSWYFLKGVDVQASEANAAAVVAFGDSITDGALSTQNANHRWPDYLATRLKGNPATANLAVLDQGIGGNCILIHCTGPNALARFDRDVLSQAGVRYLIVLEGINDIGRLHSPNLPDYKLTAEDLEQGLMQLVARAHVHGIKVFGATLTPYKGAGYFTDKGEQIREALNKWILTSGVFDGTIDFDKATQDPANPQIFSAQADGGDHLHPKDPGYQIMADSIDLGLFR
ncbi:MAG TPA: SGNH/GDSL hydrolase family protein [Terracidiphilus sp.]|jgi:lysophospholipase L1-like esterase|nr:SGNH/GDSL hydrolase family protein [Terracidiphilus sp.]